MHEVDGVVVLTHPDGSRTPIPEDDMAKARTIRDRAVSLQGVQVAEWETRHAEAIGGATMLEDSLAALRARIDRETYSQSIPDTMPPRIADGHLRRFS